MKDHQEASSLFECRWAQQACARLRALGNVYSMFTWARTCGLASQHVDWFCAKWGGVLGQLNPNKSCALEERCADGDLPKYRTDCALRTWRWCWPIIRAQIMCKCMVPGTTELVVETDKPAIKLLRRGSLFRPEPHIDNWSYIRSLRARLTLLPLMLGDACSSPGHRLDALICDVQLCKSWLACKVKFHHEICTFSGWAWALESIKFAILLMLKIFLLMQVVLAFRGLSDF